MNTDTFLNAVGMIDDRFLDIDVPQKKIMHRRRRKALLIAAAAAVMFLCPLPALTVCGVESAYNVLYHIAPAAAQTFKPVQKSCEDQGIEMTVISAERRGSKVSVYLAMQDKTGTRSAGNWDLYSYSVHVRRGMIGHCSFSEYDADTHTAYFVVHQETADGSPMPACKLTFSVSELLLGREHTEKTLDEIDMSSIPYEPQTELRSEISGGYYDGEHGEEPNPLKYRFLTVPEQPLCTPATGVSIMNIGYIDGALHILTRYDDKHHTDNHGHISLRANECISAAEGSEIGFYYWDSAHQNDYMEQIIPAHYENLSKCSLYGEFDKAQEYVSGRWQVTLPV